MAAAMVMVFAREAAGKVFFTKKSGVLWTFSSLRSPQAIISLVCTSTTKMTPYIGLKRRSMLSIFSAKKTFFCTLMWVESMTSISGGFSGVTAAVTVACVFAKSSWRCPPCSWPCAVPFSKAFVAALFSKPLGAARESSPSAISVSKSSAPESVAAMGASGASGSFATSSFLSPPKMQEPIMKQSAAKIPRAIMRLRSRWAYGSGSMGMSYSFSLKIVLR